MLVAIPELPESASSQQAQQGSGQEQAQQQQAGGTSPLAAEDAASSQRAPPVWGRPPRTPAGQEESSSPFRSVEINSAGAAPSPYARHPRKGEMAGGSPLGSPGSPRRAEAHVTNGLQQLEPALREHAFQQQMLQEAHHTEDSIRAPQKKEGQLKKQQQLQHQILLEHFEAQRQQLAEQHEHQLRQHLKELWEQKRAEEERARREQERLELLRKKDKHEQSAVASTEVKQKLQGFLLSKKAAQEAKAAAANGVAASPGSVSSGAGSQGGSSSGGFRNWSVLQPPGDGSGPSSSSASGSSPGSAPYPRPQLQLGKYDDDFPLRKTASEPNLKVRLKQRVIERRNSPLVRRKQERLCSMRRRSQLARYPILEDLLTLDSACSSNPDSGPNSPPSSAAGGPSQSQAPRGSTPIQEEGSSTYGNALAGSSGNQGSMSDLSQLYSSPSMPNISLGRPPAPSSSQEGSMKLPSVSEAEVRAAFAARFGMPLTGQMLPGTLPFYPTLPDGEYSNPSSPSYIQKQMQSLEQAAHHPHGLLPAMYHAAAAPITDAQVAHARLNKQGARPLGRTQSAPLPLGHPMLAGTLSLSHYQEIPESWQELLAEQQQQQQLALQEQQQQQHNRLKQQIRQTVLTRAGGRVAAQQQSQPPPLEQALEVDDGAEVIDLTERGSREGGSEMARQQRDREQFLQQQRDLMMRHTLQVSEGSAFTPRTPHVARPLSRALSSPLVALGQQQQQAPPEQLQGKAGSLATALAFDSLMLKHACICGDNSGHPEHGGRLQSIWARLQETGLALRCCRLRARKATLEELQSCHSEAHTLLFGTNPLNRQKLDVSKLAQLPIKSFVRLPCGGVGVDSDTTWNELHTSSAARMAAGCVIDLANKAACGEIRNGFAVVRPPGHHAEPSQAMGFCFFNSVAVAARQLQQRFDLDKILIVDWDVHHGNGTQQMFYDDPRVLYLSIHRHDDGNFFPGTGGPTECGSEDGVGFNVNLAWSGGLSPPMGDAEYLAAFRTIVMPIARDFDPDLVLVSAGFDAAAGHPAPLGGYQVSAACFGYMTHQLLQLANGKVVLSLEGGYDLPAICDAAQECVRALLGDEPSPLLAEELRRPPCQNAIDTLQKTIAIQTPHWPCVKRLAHTVSWSALEAGQKERDESEAVTAMASLSMQQRGGSGSSLHLPAERCPSLEEPMDQDEVKTRKKSTTPILLVQ